MDSAKLRYRTEDGALHLHEVQFLDEDGWTIHVDPEVTLPRLPSGVRLFDVQIIVHETPPLARHRREATAHAKPASVPGKAAVCLL